MSKIKTKGKVLRVIDGDTLEVAVKVRMARIDAPETKGVEKPLGLIAKDHLKAEIEGEQVMLEMIANDIYYRILAEVYKGNENINDEMLEEKQAEVYTPKNHNNGKLDV